MKDLTQGPVSGQVLAMAAQIAVGMVFQTLYFLIDLYFVGRLGDDAIAGVSMAGNVTFIVMALTQVLAVGTVALVSQAVGRRDFDDATLVFNQSLVLALVTGVCVLLAGYLLAPLYMDWMAADAASADAGKIYLAWYMPGLALQFAVVGMASALRGTGIVKPTMIVQVFTVVLNALLAPVLIGGWGTGHALGVAGAGLASSLAISVGVLVLMLYFLRLEHTVSVDRRLLAMRFAQVRRILAVGLPSGAEFLLLFAYMAVIYGVIARFGSEAQAGFGIGQRIMQSMFLPVMALAFAAAPIAGQSFGAGDFARVRATFRFAALSSSVLMLALSITCHIAPGLLIGAFTHDPAVVDIGAEFLQYISWNFVATGLVFTCSSLFQAMGNTVPALVSSACRLFAFVLALLWISDMPGFALRHVWWLSIAATTLQALLSLWLLRREYALRLQPVRGTLSPT